MVVNTAREKITAIEKLKRPIMLIADECHRFASAENSKIFKLNSQSSLGISATAERQYDEGLRDVLIPNLGKIIYEYSLLQATEDKVISNFQLVNIEIPMTQDETTEYGKYSKRIGIAISQGDMEKVKMLSILRSSVSKNAIARIPASC
jgi:superfamily II DNA or RNA helicase